MRKLHTVSIYYILSFACLAAVSLQSFAAAKLPKGLKSDDLPLLTQISMEDLRNKPNYFLYTKYDRLVYDLGRGLEQHPAPEDSVIRDEIREESSISSQLPNSANPTEDDPIHRNWNQIPVGLCRFHVRQLQVRKDALNFFLTAEDVDSHFHRGRTPINSLREFLEDRYNVVGILTPEAWREINPICTRCL